MSEKQQLILEAYRKCVDENLYSEWREAYQATCEKAKQYGKMDAKQKDEFYRLVWREKSNGVASVGQGTIGEEVYKRILPYLPEMTDKIIHEPKQESLNFCVSKMYELKEKGLLKTAKLAVVFRAFAMASPEQFCTIANLSGLKNLCKRLNHDFEAGLPTNWDWFELSKGLISWLKDIGVESEDPYMLSTFCWYLYDCYDSIFNVGSKMKKNNSTVPLNQILYGPPGTGKTFNTINHAVAICDNDSVDDLKQEERKVIKARYEELVDEGRIMFATFHQSMSYEDFIEGIKPDLNESSQELSYIKEDGIFKIISERALKNFKDSKRDKDSLSESQRFDKAIKLFGESWSDKQDVFELTDKCHLTEVKENSFRYSGAAWKDNFLMQYSDLHELYKNDVTSRKEVQGLESTSRSAYWHATYYFATYQEILKYLPEKEEVSQVEELPYVLIVDEINRGNVSAIFGELITLLEDDKRLGEDNELTVTLPYSKKEFYVPKNLHIIGTMNTADRSVEALDTALRRRFSFTEMMPKPELLSTDIEGVNLKQMLETINERLEILVGRDHTIGHAFFMKVNSMKTLIKVFKDKVIPQLQEYFYGDWEKIGLVLGGSFVKKKEASLTWPTGFDQDGVDDRIVWQLTPYDEWNPADLNQALNGTKGSES